MDIVADVSGLYLPVGTDWVEVQAGGTASNGPWCPPVTILGETTTGNALQNSGGWDTWLDSGTSTGLGMPFIIEGTTSPQATNDIGIIQIISPVSGSELGMETVTVNIKNFGTDDQSNFEVSFSVNGATAVVETVTATVPSNGNLSIPLMLLLIYLNLAIIQLKLVQCCLVMKMPVTTVLLKWLAICSFRVLLFIQ